MSAHNAGDLASMPGSEDPPEKDEVIHKLNVKYWNQKLLKESKTEHTNFPLAERQFQNYD